MVVNFHPWLAIIGLWFTIAKNGVVWLAWVSHLAIWVAIFLIRLYQHEYATQHGSPMALEVLCPKWSQRSDWTKVARVGHEEHGQLCMICTWIIQLLVKDQYLCLSMGTLTTINCSSSWSFASWWTSNISQLFTICSSALSATIRLNHEDPHESQLKSKLNYQALAITSPLTSSVFCSVLHVCDQDEVSIHK